MSPSKNNKELEFRKTMAELGFEEADDKIYPRIISSIHGMEFTGKTNLSMTFPDPVAVFSSDIGTEGVVNKFKRNGKDIWVHEIEMPEKYEESKVIWKGFKDAYKKILRVKEIRTVVMDTATEIWELIRICKFGKLTQVMPFQYGPVNAEFRKLLKMPYASQKNLVMLQKMRPVYIDDKRTNDYEPAGFGDTRHLAQVRLETFRTTPKKSCDHCKKKDGKHRHWGVKVIKCRQNAELVDKIFTDGMCDMSIIGPMITGGESEEWE